mmetsp:Transcript_8964/g.17498  ORF Transcript_8964/g.17498 Transcript_8964/m.17498 type:complete len:87 (-) Transcript_8964:945-1205(-)
MLYLVPQKEKPFLVDDVISITLSTYEKRARLVVAKNSLTNAWDDNYDERKVKQETQQAQDSRREGQKEDSVPCRHFKEGRTKLGGG